MAGLVTIATLNELASGDQVAADNKLIMWDTTSSTTMGITYANFARINKTIVRKTGSNQTISANTDTKIVFDSSVDFDPNNNWDTTNSKWTAPYSVAMRMVIQLPVTLAQITTSDSPVYWRVWAKFNNLNSNNVRTYIGHDFSTGGTPRTTLYWEYIYGFESGDYVEFYCRQNSSGSLLIEAGDGGSYPENGFPIVTMEPWYPIVPS